MSNNISIVGYYRENETVVEGEIVVKDVINDKSKVCKIDTHGYYCAVLHQCNDTNLYEIECKNCTKLVYVEHNVGLVISTIELNNPVKICDIMLKKDSDLWYTIEAGNEVNKLVIIVRTKNVGTDMHDKIVAVKKVTNKAELRFNYSGEYEVIAYALDSNMFVMNKKIYNIIIENGPLNIIKETIKYKYANINSNNTLGEIEIIELDGNIHLEDHTGNVQNNDIDADIESSDPEEGL